jgi:hypothetical protein
MLSTTFCAIWSTSEAGGQELVLSVPTEDTVLVAANMKMTILWDVVVCSLVEVY